MASTLTPWERVTPGAAGIVRYDLRSGLHVSISTTPRYSDTAQVRVCDDRGAVLARKDLSLLYYGDRSRRTCSVGLLPSLHWPSCCHSDTRRLVSSASITQAEELSHADYSHLSCRRLLSRRGCVPRD